MTVLNKISTLNNALIKLAQRKQHKNNAFVFHLAFDLRKRNEFLLNFIRFFFECT